MGNRQRVSRWAASRRRASVCRGGAAVSRDVEPGGEAYVPAGGEPQSLSDGEAPAAAGGEAPAAAGGEAPAAAGGETPAAAGGEAYARGASQPRAPAAAGASEPHAPASAAASDPINAYATALANAVRLSLAFLATKLSLELSAAMPQVAALLQELSGEIAQVRASMEAMPQGTPKAREAKAASVAILAAIEAKLSLNLSPCADEQRSAPPEEHEQTPMEADKVCAELSLFVDGELEAERATIFRDHLVGCEECRSGLLKAQQWVARLSERKEPSETKGPT